ncbi:MAG: phosphoribosylamine--glycine ligase [Phycisphaerae bacterium]|jgi:phosphoribosylamine--glycine ligase|nr:phosphoribosylamine--glycine ligase [Phycisphaerae bacterium]
MKVLVIGGGGREHALVWKIAQSPLVDRVYCAPGNPGMEELAELVPIKPDDIEGLLAFAKKEGIGLTVVGPEDPLIAGIVDLFESEGLRIFGPSKDGAQLEGSKAFAKELMNRHAVATAEYCVCEDMEEALRYIDTHEEPLVVKASGLAKGKGVMVCDTQDEARAAVRDIMQERIFGDAGDLVLIEERLVGEEASIIVLTDGTNIYPLESSQDHKPALDGDKGPNTGGMGAYSPAPVVTDEVMAHVEREILVPIVHGLKMEGITYRGVLYVGLMITAGGAKVLEFNVRLGDPETQPILARLKSDIVPALEATIDGRLDRATLEWDPRAAICVVMASGGYPGEYEKGMEITGLDAAAEVPDTVVFHAGTKREGEKIVTAGGRVLGVTALGDTISDARDAAYDAVSRIHFHRAHWRTDIAAKALKRLV